MHETSYDRETFGEAAGVHELLVAWKCFTAAVSSPVGFHLILKGGGGCGLCPQDLNELGE